MDLQPASLDESRSDLLKPQYATKLHTITVMIAYISTSEVELSYLSPFLVLYSKVECGPLIPDPEKCA